MKRSWFSHPFIAPAAWAAVCGVGWGLRLLYLSQPLRYDEAVTFLAVGGSSLGAALSAYSPNNHLFHTFWLLLSTRLFGPQEWAVRLPAFLAGAALIPSLGFVGRRVFGRAEGLLGAALAASSGWLIFYSVNARGYSLAVLCLVWSFYAAWKELKGAGVWWGWAAGLGAGLAVAAVPTMLWPVSGLWLAVGAVKAPWPQRLSRLIRLGLAVGLAGGAWYLPAVLKDGLDPLLKNPHVAPVGLAAALGSMPPQVIEVAKNIWPLMDLGWFSAALIVAAAAIILWRRPTLEERFLLFLLIWPFFLELIQRVRAPARSFLFLTPLVYFLWLRAAPKTWRAGGSPLRLAGLALGLVLAAGGFLAATKTIPSLAETGLSPHAPQVAAFLQEKAGLASGDRVVADVPDDAPLTFYLVRRGFGGEVILPRGRLEGGRIFVLEGPRNSYDDLTRRWPGLAQRRRKEMASWDGWRLWRLR